MKRDRYFVLGSTLATLLILGAGCPAKKPSSTSVSPIKKAGTHAFGSLAMGSVQSPGIGKDGASGLVAPQAYVGPTTGARDAVDAVAGNAEKGGVYGGYGYQGTDVQTIDVALGTPEIVLTTLWLPGANGGASAELDVPALRFPVLDAPKDQPYFQKGVIVPMAKEILEQSSRSVPTPGPIPLEGKPIIR